MQEVINRHMKCSCENCQLKSLFFSNVKVDELTDICDIKEEFRYAKGDIIIKEGESIKEFIVEAKKYI